ncbi:MAG: HoxN/HupN/NixA family nickel/cobalt transporter, partial [Rhabdochlamydiaceae bacterium]
LDADHIAAIDNTTRKLMQHGKRSYTVGMWFSLGHSTTVFGLVVSLVLATHAVLARIPSLKIEGASIGSAASGVFLWLIAAINIVIVIEIYRVFESLHKGKVRDDELESLLASRGLMNKIFGGLSKLIENPRQIYFVGILFGLGFDTASEVALIAISVGVGISSPIPIWAVLILPLMFTCGMVLVDTCDSVAMGLAYGWAFLNPIRKIYYNLVITIISVLVATLIGTIELLQVVSSELHFTGVFWLFLSRMDLETIGLWTVCIFIGTWGVSMLYYKLGKIDTRPSSFSQPSAAAKTAHE